MEKTEGAPFYLGVLKQFHKAGRDISKFEGITPVGTLDEIKDGSTVWILKDGTYNAIAMVHPKQVHDGYLRIVSDGGIDGRSTRKIEGRYDPARGVFDDGHYPIGIIHGKVFQEDVRQGCVYTVKEPKEISITGSP